MSLPSYSRFLALLASQAANEPAPVPGQCYRWSCGCDFVWACNDWQWRYYCPRHRHLRDHPEGVLLARSEGVGL